MAKKSIEQEKLLAGLMYLVSIFGLIGMAVSVVIWAVKRDNRFIAYHFKQLLVLWICGIILGVAGAVTLIFIVGIIILIAGGILFFILWIIGMINAFSGVQKPLPLIGKFGESLKF